MQINSYNQMTNSQANMIERIANLPKEIFQAQMVTSEKIMKLAIEQNIQGSANKENGLDILA
ncbi:MAG: hypothetical protein MH321_06765 [Leptospiraceae bacterium]|nr:hypothetical protein [Leptospiraceae bacterium]